MKKPSQIARALCCTALTAAAWMPAGVRAAARDLGAVPASTQVAAVIWLQPHDSAAFADAVQARETPGSSLYHSWMSAAEVSAYGATSTDVQSLAASLRAQGLHVTLLHDDADALAVSGGAASMGNAFGTELHGYRDDAGGAEFVAPVSAPHYSGAGADRIAGVTGLSTSRMMPMLRRAKLAGAVPATIADPNALFTANCFQRNETLTYSKFAVGGVNTGVYNGPEYAATGQEKSAKACGYTPAQVLSHYHLAKSGLTGRGQTIVLVEAYGDPSIFAEANAFSGKFGLPLLTAANLTIVQPDGVSQTNPYQTDWANETALDVEWVHAIAPAAKIVIVEAPSDDTTELVYALHFAIRHNLGSIISNSYSGFEAGVGALVAQAFSAVARQGAAQGIAVNAAAGDAGDGGLGTPFGAAASPADSPYVTAVGGTSLGVPADGGPVDSVWGTQFTYLAGTTNVAIPPQPGGFEQGGGGGESNVFTAPAWQKLAGIQGAGRQLPDVSAIADPLTGGIVAVPNVFGSESVLTVFGGTSLSTPVFSAIWALAQEKAGASLGQAAPMLAALGGRGMTDIVPVSASLSNLTAMLSHAGVTTSYDPAQLLGISTLQPTGFVGVSEILPAQLGAVYDLSFGADTSLMAGPGWDDATGWGEPDGMKFIDAVSKAAKR